MVKIDTNRAEKTKRWKIPEKFINIEFTNFLCNINVLELNNKYIDTIPIKNDADCIVAYINRFRLWELHGIDLHRILNLLRDTGCAIIKKKDNYIKYHHQNLEYLMNEINARIDKNE